MRLRILIDMNLSPAWVGEFAKLGWSATHWMSVGDPKASDQVILEWARLNGCLVFTHDLDFGTAVALTHAVGPSVLQVRSQRVLPQQILPLVVTAIKQYETELVSGAIVVIDEARSRVRILPIL